MTVRHGLRLRIATLAAISVGIVLAVGAAILTMTLQSRLDDAATTAAELRARDVAALAEGGGLPPTLALPGEESAYVQVVDASSLVIASTSNIEGEEAISPYRPPESSPQTDTVVVAPLPDLGEMRVATLTVSTSTGSVTVYAGESLSGVRSTTAAVVLLLVIGVPLLTLLVGALAWWVVGRTLRPVREITSTMSEITASDLHRRVPVGTVTDEIAELATTVNATLMRLDTAVAKQRRFVADASHELRSPLAALRADLEISVTHPAQSNWVNVADNLLGDVERLQILTEDLLLLAHLDAEQPPANPVDLAPLLQSARTTIRRPDLVISLTGVGIPCLVQGDEAQLQRMLRNVVHNAELHAAGRIDLDLTITGPVARLTVSDDGPGIPVDMRPHVFERFVRLDEARTRNAGGTGLGLAIVADIVAAHRGTITIDDADLGGAAFVIEIPTADSPAIT
ncbi:ATP-binding protein [Ilumatobacter sp.]|uniref:sensor histidine kinase n=1 Tax=Ilumatobacter sp. TaxID=1967498 RepID=UPI003752DDBE